VRARLNRRELPGLRAVGGAANPGAGVTTGAGPGTTGTDAAVSAENQMIDRKIKSICRGC